MGKLTLTFNVKVEQLDDARTDALAEARDALNAAQGLPPHVSRLLVRRAQARLERAQAFEDAIAIMEGR